MIDIVTVFLSLFALIISATTAYLSLFRKGTVKMTKPTIIYFGPDRSCERKVFLRTLLYSTSKRGRIVESMWVKLRRGESAQSFNIWVYGDASIARGSGMYVGDNGVVCNHHFLLPKDGTTFEFLPGDYLVETYASLVNGKHPLLLSQIRLHLSKEQADAIINEGAGIYFDWGPDSASYQAHLDLHPEKKLNALEEVFVEKLIKPPAT